MPDTPQEPVVHLSARALEWLAADYDPVEYKGPFGVTACKRQKPHVKMCQVQDVRAILSGKARARLQVWENGKHIDTVKRDVDYPTCPTCLDLLNRAICASPRNTARAAVLTPVPTPRREPQDL